MHSCAPIILTKQSIQDLPELQKKIRLEKIFERDIRPLFTRMIRDYKASIRAFGRPQDASLYEKQWSSILVTQYDRVQRAFRGTVLDGSIGKHMVHYLTKQSPERMESLVDIALLNWRNTQSDLVAGIITDTNQEQFDVGLQRAREALIEEEEEVNPTSLSLAAAAIVGRQFRVRTSTISLTETQNAAETTKSIEASVIAGRVPAGVLPIPEPIIIEPEPEQERLPINKQWVTIGDNRVRASHVAVNRTIIDEAESFTVGGDLLKYPGDNSQGASAAQFINCRCSADYSVRRG